MQDDGRSVGTHTLIELSVATPGHCRVVTAIDLRYVVALDRLDLVHSEVSGERYLEAKLRTATNTTTYAADQVNDNVGVAVKADDRVPNNR